MISLEDAVKHWPAPEAKLREYKDGKVSFEKVTLTIDRVFPNDAKGSYGLKFVGDTTDDGRGYQGVIWNMKGKWDEQARAFDDYIGDRYEAGDVVDVGLRVSSGKDRNFYDVGWISPRNAQREPVEQAPQGDPREEWAEQEHEKPASLTLDQKIAKAQALNLLYDVLNSGESPAEKMETLKGMYFASIEEAKQVAGEQWNNLRLGLPAFPDPEPEPVKPEPEFESGMAPADDDWITEYD